jgi:hypothetical protein
VVAKPEISYKSCHWAHPSANSSHLSLLLLSKYDPPTSILQTNVNKRFCHQKRKTSYSQPTISMHYPENTMQKGEAIPLQAWTGP